MPWKHDLWVGYHFSARPVSILQWFEQTSGSLWMSPGPGITRVWGNFSIWDPTIFTKVLQVASCCSRRFRMVHHEPVTYCHRTEHHMAERPEMVCHFSKLQAASGCSMGCASKPRCPWCHGRRRDGVGVAARCCYCFYLLVLGVSGLPWFTRFVPWWS